jgi:integrase
MAYPVAVAPAGGQRTWTVLGEDYATVGPVEEWIEAHRHLWSPNTVRGYATSLAQWWSFLEQRGQADSWGDVGVPAVSAFLSWLRNGRTVEHSLAGPDEAPTAATLEARLAALISFYRWHQAVSGVAVAGRLLRGTPRRRPARGLLAHLDGRSTLAASSLVRVRRGRRSDRPLLLLPQQIQAILDCCAVFDPQAGSWRGNLRDRFLFALLAETGMRLGEALGLRIGEFVLGRGGTAYVEIVPREDNPNGARVKMMRPRRVYVGADLERLFADWAAPTRDDSGRSVFLSSEPGPIPGFPSAVASGVAWARHSPNTRCASCSAHCSIAARCGPPTSDPNRCAGAQSPTPPGAEPRWCWDETEREAGADRAAPRPPRANPPIRDRN